MITILVQIADVPPRIRRHVGARRGRGVVAVSTPPLKDPHMTCIVILASALLAVLLTLAWAKEFRLRRALQALLARIFTHWRPAHESDPTNRSHPD